MCIRDSYNPAGIRIGGESVHRSALQVAGERNFQDFREDNILDIRSFQMAFRKLRQFSSKNDGPKTELNVDATIQETCDNEMCIRDRRRQKLQKGCDGQEGCFECRETGARNIFFIFAV